MSDTIISIVMLAAVALVAGSVFLFRRGQKKQAGLMLILALVMFINAAIWLVPTGEGGDIPGQSAANAR